MEEYDRISYGFGRRVPKTEQNKFGWLELKPQDVAISPNGKPIILFFGGNGSVKPEDANHNSKITEQFIGTQSCDIYSFYYGRNKETSQTGDLSVEELAEIYSTFIEPLITDQNGAFLAQEQIEQNLSNLIFISHCQGNLYANYLVNKTFQRLVEQGYQQDIAQNLTRNIFHLTYAPWHSNIKDKEQNCTQVEFTTFRDKIHECIGSLYEDENEEIPYFAEGKLFRQDNKLLLVANSFVDFDELLDEHSISTIQLTKSGVAFQHDQRALTIANCFANSLAYAVLNKVNLDDLQMILQNELDKEHNVEWEKRQAQLYEWYRTGGKPVDVFMQENGITEEQIINGEVKLQDKIPYFMDRMGFKEYQLINYNNSNYKRDYNYSILTKHSSNKNIMITNPRYFEAKRTSNYIITKDGCYSSYVANDLENLYSKCVNAKIYNQDLSNSVLVEVNRQDKEDLKQNTIMVNAGNKFEDKHYTSFDELRQSMIPSIEEGKEIELSPEQTRFILSEAILNEVPASNIFLAQGISLNQNVVESEIKVENDKIINANAEKINSNSQQK